MSLQIRYNRVTTAGGVDPDHITARMGVAFSSAAEEGAVAQSQIVVDDVSNTLDYVGLRRVYAFETAAQAHNQIIWNGYLQERGIGRQPAEGQDQDEEIFGRRWTLTVADTNSYLSRRLITGADGDRPAETDVARIQWLLDSNDAYLSNPQDNWANPSAYVNTGGPVDMDAADLRGQTAFDVLNDCAQRSGKNWFAFYDETLDTVPPTNAGYYTLFYDLPTSTAYSSTLRLTNYGDEDNVTTFAVLPDALLSRDPSRVYSGIYLTGDGVSLYQQSTNVINLFQRRDAAVSNPNINTMTKATALATRYLADAATEDDRLTCRFVVAKQYVNDLREGQRFQAKFYHLPGYTSYAYWRCLRRTVTQLNDEFYEIAIEATPAPVPAVAGVVQQKSGTANETGGGTLATTNAFASPVTAGHLLILVIAHRAAGNFPPNYWNPQINIPPPDPTWIDRPFTLFPGGEAHYSTDPMAGDWVRILYRVATGDEQAMRFNTLVNASWTMYELSGWGGTPASFEVRAATDQAAAGTKSLGAYATAAAGDIQIAGFIYGKSDPVYVTDQTVGAGWTEDQQVKSVTLGDHPGMVQMHASTGPAPSISGGSYQWAAVAVNIPHA